MTTLAVVEEILRVMGRPVSVREIVEAAGERLPTRSKTPDTVVARDLSMDIKNNGEASRFVRTSPGRYTMKELIAEQAPSRAPAPTPVLSAAIREERAGTRSATPTPVQSSERAITQS